MAAAILVDKDSVQSDLETTSGQTFNSGNTSFYNALAVQLSKVLGGSKSSAPMNNGITNTVTTTAFNNTQTKIRPRSAPVSGLENIFLEIVIFYLFHLIITRLGHFLYQ